MRKKWKLTPFGISVKKKLLEKGMSLNDLAEEIGVSQSFLSQILYGDKKGYKYIEPIQMLLELERDTEEFLPK